MKLIDNWKQHLKSYSALSLFANVLIGVSYGLSLSFGMGVMTLQPIYIVAAMLSVAVMGSLGKFLKQELGEKDKEDV
ncbi:hypothetical protein [Pseudomonas sp.]|uniref:hypothetical protein n=1 Tax=Pseudomonas sp. TaxID=306 RepID=UPI003FD7A210